MIHKKKKWVVEEEAGDSIPPLLNIMCVAMKMVWQKSKRSCAKVA